MNLLKANQPILYWLILIVVAYFALFHKLDSAPFYMWDEGVLPFIKITGFNELGLRLASATKLLRYNSSLNPIIVCIIGLTKGKYILTTKLERDIDVNNLFELETILKSGDCAYYKIISKK